jgi:hypothetical protein
MDGRARVRGFLSGAPTDRAPVLAFVSELSAQLSQASMTDLYADPHLLTEVFLQSLEVFGLDAIVLQPPVQAVREGMDGTDGDPFGALKEGIRRLRMLVGDRAGIVLVLPGPSEVAGSAAVGDSSADPDEQAAGLLAVARSLEPPDLDCLALFEGGPLAAAAAASLHAATSVLWNAARFYSMPSLLICGRAGPEVAPTGASAVAVFDGVTPGDLAAAGATRVGVPAALGRAPGPRPPSGFFITAGEIPKDADVGLVQAFIARLRDGTAGDEAGMASERGEAT